MSAAGPAGHDAHESRRRTDNGRLVGTEPPRLKNLVGQRSELLRPIVWRRNQHAITWTDHDMGCESRNEGTP
jgi:hypothetical protein